MSKLCLILSAITLSASVAAAQEFVAVPQSGGPGVWIVNTATGEPKFCAPRSSEGGGYILVCITENR